MAGGRTRSRTLTAPPIAHPWVEFPATYAASMEYTEGVYQGSGFVATTFDVPTVVKWEWMSDSVGSKHEFHPVHHAQGKLALEPPFNKAVISDWEPLDNSVVWEVGTPPLVLPYEELAIDNQALHDFAWDLFHKASAQIPEQMSVANFLWDLPEAKNLLSAFKGMRKTIRRIKSVLNRGSGAFLSYQYGIKPMLSDIKGLATFYTATKKRIAFLRKTQGKTFRVRLSRRIIDDPQPDPNGDGTLEAAGTWFYSSSDVAYGISEPANWVYRLGPSLTRYVGCVSVENRLTGLESLENQLDAYAAALGLNNPTKVIWDKIPFSFLLEYFVNLDNLFHDLANNPVANPFDGQLVVREGWYSVKRIQRIDVWRPVPTGYLPCSAKYERMASVWNKQYIRNEGLPLGSYISWKGDLSSLQRALMAALLINKAT